MHHYIVIYIAKWIGYSFLSGVGKVPFKPIVTKLAQNSVDVNAVSLSPFSLLLGSIKSHLVQP